MPCNTFRRSSSTTIRQRKPKWSKSFAASESEVSDSTLVVISSPTRRWPRALAPSAPTASRAKDSPSGFPIRPSLSARHAIHLSPPQAFPVDKREAGRHLLRWSRTNDGASPHSKCVPAAPPPVAREGGAHALERPPDVLPARGGRPPDGPPDKRRSPLARAEGAARGPSRPPLSRMVSSHVAQRSDL